LKTCCTRMAESRATLTMGGLGSIWATKPGLFLNPESPEGPLSIAAMLGCDVETAKTLLNNLRITSKKPMSDEQLRRCFSSSSDQDHGRGLERRRYGRGSPLHFKFVEWGGAGQCYFHHPLAYDCDLTMTILLLTSQHNGSASGAVPDKNTTPGREKKCAAPFLLTSPHHY
jgi:hypothetical protein